MYAVRPLEGVYLTKIEPDIPILYSCETVSDMALVGIVNHANGLALQKGVELPDVELGTAGVEGAERERVIVRVETVERGNSQRRQAFARTFCEPRIRVRVR